MNKKNDKKGIQQIIPGPSYGLTNNFPKRDMWKEIAKEVNGEFKIKYNQGSGLETHNLSIPYKNLKIEISVSDTKPLKFQTSLSVIQDFNLTISEEDFFEKLIKKISNPKIKLGWKKFDDHYSIKSNSSYFVKSTITKDIQETLLRHNIYSISYQTNSSKKTAELLVVIQRSAGKKDVILELIEMNKLLIDNLDKSGIIIHYA